MDVCARTSYRSPRPDSSAPDRGIRARVLCGCRRRPTHPAPSHRPAHGQTASSQLARSQKTEEDTRSTEYKKRQDGRPSGLETILWVAQCDTRDLAVRLPAASQFRTGTTSQTTNHARSRLLDEPRDGMCGPWTSRRDQRGLAGTGSKLGATGRRTSLPGRQAGRWPATGVPRVTP
jgi:hypothetical protein